MSHPDPDPREPDPVLASSRREALVALAAWFVAGVFTIGWCWTFGYRRDPELVRYYLGIPDWVLFGIFLPWIAVNVFVGWFALCYVRDEDLGEIEEGETKSADTEAQAP